MNFGKEEKTWDFHTFETSLTNLDNFKKFRDFKIVKLIFTTNYKLILENQSDRIK